MALGGELVSTRMGGGRARLSLRVIVGLSGTGATRLSLLGSAPPESLGDREGVARMCVAAVIIGLVGGDSDKDKDRETATTATTTTSESVVIKV
jgi:hypothetical protein